MRSAGQGSAEVGVGTSMTLGVGRMNELVAAAFVALGDPDVTTMVGAAVVDVPEGVAGAAASLVHPARPTDTIATRATANLLVIGRTPRPLWAIRAR